MGSLEASWLLINGAESPGRLGQRRMMSLEGKRVYMPEAEDYQVMLPDSTCDSPTGLV